MYWDKNSTNTPDLQNINKEKALAELCTFVGIASLMLRSLKNQGIRRAQEEHTLATKFVLGTPQRNNTSITVILERSCFR